MWEGWCTRRTREPRWRSSIFKEGSLGQGRPGPLTQESGPRRPVPLGRGRLRMPSWGRLFQTVLWKAAGGPLFSPHPTLSGTFLPSFCVCCLTRCPLLLVPLSCSLSSSVALTVLLLPSHSESPCLSVCLLSSPQSLDRPLTCSLPGFLPWFPHSGRRNGRCWGRKS